MHEYLNSLLVLIATPLFAILIGVEVVLSHIYNKHYNHSKETLINIYTAAMSFGLDILIRGVGFFFLFIASLISILLK